MHFFVYLFIAVLVECFLVGALASLCDKGSADEKKGAAFGSVVLAIVFLLGDVVAMVVWVAKHW